MLISIVVAVRNGAETIQRTLDSVYAQTDTGWELVVIDGASIDATPTILERNASRLAYWESEPDRGISHAWNKALDHTVGDWVLFLGADDRLHGSDTVGAMRPHLERVPAGCDVVYGRVDVVGPDGSVLSTAGLPWTDLRDDFRDGMTIPHQATFHRRAAYDRVGRYDERYRISADYDVLLRLLPNGDPMFVDVVVADMGAGGISDRPGSGLVIARETHRILRAHGLTSVPAWRSLPLAKAKLIDVLESTLGVRRTNRMRGWYRSARGRSV